MYDFIYSDKNGTIKVWYKGDVNWRERAVVIEPEQGEPLYLNENNALSLIQGIADVLRDNID